MNLKPSWQIVLTALSLLAIALYLILAFAEIPYAELPLYGIILAAGIPLLMQLIVKLYQGNYGADILAALAMITAVIMQEYLTAVIIILMLASGQALERFAMRKASSVLLALGMRMPSLAHRKVNNQVEEIPLQQIRLDDEVIVYPHETCPVDGIVLEGYGWMDESYLTGEPYQISKAPGATVLSGAINGDSPLTIKTCQLVSNSRYAAIVQVLEEAELKRPSIRRLGDQVGAWFAPVALLLALLAWYASGDGLRFLAVLVIATPCPLLIAIPITILSAISKAAKHSIIIKDPSVLEQLPVCKTAIFDKTGTLTFGRPTLTEIILTASFSEPEILQLVASLERYSKHPLAFAILNAAEAKQLPFLEATQIAEIPGQGLQGIVNDHRIKITGRKKLLPDYPLLHAKLPAEKIGLECLVLVDDTLAALLYFRDPARPETEPFIRHLQPAHQFSKIMIVSGDRESEVQYLGQQLNINAIYASQSPEQKLAIVRQEVRLAPTVFMGDGINDAPALTAATVGIAFGEFSNVTAEAASAVIMENSFGKVDELVHLCLKTRTIILQSALGGMALSLIGMLFAALGYIPPVTGAIIQELIDILAIINALRLAAGKEINIDMPQGLLASSPTF